MSFSYADTPFALLLGTVALPQCQHKSLDGQTCSKRRMSIQRHIRRLGGFRHADTPGALLLRTVGLPIANATGLNGEICGDGKRQRHIRELYGSSSWSHRHTSCLVAKDSSAAHCQRNRLGWSHLRRQKMLKAYHETHCFYHADRPGFLLLKPASAPTVRPVTFFRSS